MTTMIAPLERRLAWLRRSWRAMGLGRRHDGGHYRRMDRLYLRHDPWRLSSERERQRFHLTNALVARIVPDCGSLLELGSAEGAQTAHLLSVARNVTGIEVSPVAVGRARQTVPCADYLIGPAEDAVRLVRGRRFDLVMASELLYYAPEPSAILTAMKSLAPQILVINYEKRARGLTPLLEGPGWTRLDDLVAGNVRWRCDLWSAGDEI